MQSKEYPSVSSKSPDTTIASPARGLICSNGGKHKNLRTTAKKHSVRINFRHPVAYLRHTAGRHGKGRNHFFHTIGFACRAYRFGGLSSNKKKELEKIRS
jgi:hypothetical protein